MEDFGLDKIRHEGIKKIYSCIPADTTISRLEISEKTGLSLMTVGKITDFLFEKGIITYVRSEETGVGRKAKHITLSHEKKVIVLVPQKKRIKALILSLTLEKIGELELVPDENDAVGSLMGELMPFIFEHGLVGSLVGVCAVYRKNEDKDFCQKLADELANSLSLKVSLACQSESVKLKAAKKGSSVLYISKNGDGALVSYYGSEPMLGQISAKDEQGLNMKLQAIAEFLSVGEIYSEFAFENDSVCLVSEQKAYELEYIGAVMLLREKYLYN